MKRAAASASALERFSKAGCYSREFGDDNVRAKSSERQADDGRRAACFNKAGRCSREFGDAPERAKSSVACFNKAGRCSREFADESEDRSQPQKGGSGPRNVEELHQWPSWVLHRLLSGAGSAKRRERLMINLAMDVILWTRFSGMDAPIQALKASVPASFPGAFMW